MSTHYLRTVNVQTSARLHMGFYDLQAPGHYGSVGLAIDSPGIMLNLSPGDMIHPVAEVQAILEQVCDHLQITTPVQVSMQGGIPRHSGLGSGTQLAMAIGAALNDLFGLELQVQEIARLIGRGRRSGIGIAAFEQGGLLVDAGKAYTEEAPVLVRRLDFPDAWRIVLVMDSVHVGVHGAAEKRAFQTLKPANGCLRDIVLAHMLPALERRDLLAFGAYMADLQAYNGDYFAPVQGGRYASKDVESVLCWIESQGVACVGQSSWGPTGFAIVEEESFAKAICSQAQAVFEGMSHISFRICRGRNYGASVQIE
jgi:beta-RFAP synthase